MPTLLDDVSNIVGVWPLTVVHIKETGNRADDNKLVVQCIFNISSTSHHVRQLSVLFCFRKRDWWLFFVDHMARMKFRLFHMTLETSEFFFLLCFVRVLLVRIRKQDFVRNPLFTRRNFSFESRITTLSTAAASADAVQHSSEFYPRRAFVVEAGAVVTDLEACREKVFLRRKTAKDTRERWFGEGSVATSVVGEAAPRTIARKSDLAEMGDVQHVHDCLQRGLPSCGWSPSSHGKRGALVLVMSYQRRDFQLLVLLLLVLQS